MRFTATQLRQRVRLFYFSGTGNTRWAAYRFADAAERLGAGVELVPITEDMLLDESQDDTDVIGVAHPIYGADVPPIVKRFFRRLADSIGGDSVKPSLFVLTTYGFIDALGPKFEQTRMAGLPLRWYSGLHLVNNITTPKRPERIPDEDVVERRKAKAYPVIEALARDVATGADATSHVSLPSVVGPIVRKITEGAVRDHYSHIGIDRDRCVLCKLCVEQCPTNAITYTERRFHVSDRCTACMRCYSFCPVQAITIDGEYADPALYPRHRGID